MTIRFAALSLSLDHAGHIETSASGDGLEVFAGRFCDVVSDESSLASWREALGTITWDQFFKEERLNVVARQDCGPVPRQWEPDHEMSALRHRIDRFQVAWLLLLPPRFHGPGPSWEAGGEASSVAPRSSLTKVTSHSHYHHEPRPPFYVTSKRFQERLRFDDGENRLLPPGGEFARTAAGTDRRTWQSWWFACERLLDDDAAFPPLFTAALDAYQLALSHESLDFKISNLIRAAEAILALPRRNGGKDCFAARALEIAPALANDWMVGDADLVVRLMELYQIRSDSVHGKLPFDALLRIGEKAGNEMAAKFEYLAEYVARSAIGHVLVNKSRLMSMFEDRDALEESWKMGRII